MLDRPAMADNVIEEIANSQHARRRARRLEPCDALSLLQHRSTFLYVLSELPRTRGGAQAGAGVSATVQHSVLVQCCPVFRKVVLCLCAAIRTIIKLADALGRAQAVVCDAVRVQCLL